MPTSQYIDTDGDYRKPTTSNKIQFQLPNIKTKKINDKNRFILSEET